MHLVHHYSYFFAFLWTSLIYPFALPYHYFLIFPIDIRFFLIINEGILLHANPDELRSIMAYPKHVIRNVPAASRRLVLCHILRAQRC